jgi:hypothetical protein
MAGRRRRGFEDVVLPAPVELCEVVELGVLLADDSGARQRGGEFGVPGGVSLLGGESGIDWESDACHIRC